MNKEAWEEIADMTEEDFIDHLQEDAEIDDTFGPEKVYKQTKEYFLAKIKIKLQRYSISKNNYKYGDEDYGGSCSLSGLDVDKDSNGKWAKYDELESLFENKE